MAKLWRYYKYYSCTLWKRPLLWLLAGSIVYAQYESQWQIQAMIYVGFALFLPLAVASERIRKDYELDDLRTRDLANSEAVLGPSSREADVSVPDSSSRSTDPDHAAEASTSERLSETFGDTDREPLPSE
jgi:hypothetical protein